MRCDAFLGCYSSGRQLTPLFDALLPKSSLWSIRLLHWLIFLGMLSGFSKMESAHSSQKLSLSASSEKLSFERVSLRVLALVKERSYEVPGAHERLGVMLA